jgi:hypothetical protein
VSPSAATVDALARALHLSPVEHAHLREFTSHADRGLVVRETVPDELRALVEQLPPRDLHARVNNASAAGTFWPRTRVKRRGLLEVMDAILRRFMAGFGVDFSGVGLRERR